ncbi:MAG: lipopolysaccharide biosynthesis protein [Colwellia sp.]|nr:lipopolysaccharide biosynthesis protein [Colwellia sp.]
MNIEQKFEQFRATCNQSEFNDIDFLARASSIQNNKDPELAKRIKQRIKNLQRQTRNNNSANSFWHKLLNGLTKLNNKTLSLWIKKRIIHSWYGRLVLVPFVVFSLYQVFWASERFESTAQVIVQQPDGMATMDASMALLTGFGVSSNVINDNELLKSYIYSSDMRKYLDDKIELREHYMTDVADFFSRLHSWNTNKDFSEYYQDHVEVLIDDASGVITVKAQGFTPEFSEKLVSAIVLKAEKYINSIGHQLAKSQLTFIKGEHLLITNKFKQAQKDLMLYQEKYTLLDPTAEGMSKQQITYTLEGQVSLKEVELKSLLTIMSPIAPRVLTVKNDLASLKSQLVTEREKLAEKNDGNVIPVSEILSQFTDLKLNLELTLQAYTSSEISLEKSRVEAYRQLKYLITVQTAGIPDDNTYPRVWYNIILLFSMLNLVFAIIKIIWVTSKELKN